MILYRDGNRLTVYSFEGVGFFPNLSIGWDKWSLYNSEYKEYIESKQEVFYKGWKVCEPKLKGVKGTIIYGTGGEIPRNDLDYLFNHPKEYKLWKNQKK